MHTGGVVEVAKNIKRRGGERHRVFGQLNISIFNFSLAPSVGARSAVSLWLTIVDSFIADLSVLPTWYPPASLLLALSHPSLSTSVRVSHPFPRSATPFPPHSPQPPHPPAASPLSVRSLCCFNFFRGFPFRAASLHPGPSTIPPFESPSRIERIPSNYLTLRTVASVCLVEIRQNPAYRYRLLYEVTVSSIILLSLNAESQLCTNEINSDLG